jgi:hypothetical protein
LPIYGNPNPVEDVKPVVSALEEQIRSARLQASEQLSFVGEWAGVATQTAGNTIEQAKSTYQLLLDEKNTVGKAAFVTAGGLVGLTLALRRGVFRKLIYGTVGVASTAAICYPQKAHETAQVGFYIAINKLNPIIREQTGIDVQQKVQESMQRLHQFVNSYKKE